MRLTWLSTPILMVATLFSCPAEATTYSYMLSGQLSDSFDYKNVFDLAAAGNLRDTPFTATFLVSDAIADATYTYSPFQSTIARSNDPASVAPVTASLTVNGISYDFGGNTVSELYKNGPGSGSSIVATVDEGDFTKSLEHIFFSINAPYTSPDWRETGSWILPSFAGLGSAVSRDSPFDQNFGFNLRVQRLTIAEVGGPPPVEPAIPEATSWAMMMMGLGAVGVGLRNRRQVGQVNRHARGMAGPPLLIDPAFAIERGPQIAAGRVERD